MFMHACQRLQSKVPNSSPALHQHFWGYSCSARYAHSSLRPLLFRDDSPSNTLYIYMHAVVRQESKIFCKVTAGGFALYRYTRRRESKTSGQERFTPFLQVQWCPFLMCKAACISRWMQLLLFMFLQTLNIKSITSSVLYDSFLTAVWMVCRSPATLFIMVTYCLFWLKLAHVEQEAYQDLLSLAESSHSCIAIALPVCADRVTLSLFSLWRSC